MRVRGGLVLALMVVVIGCVDQPMKDLSLKVLRSSASGERFLEVQPASNAPATDTFRIDENDTKQTILGFGGAFTESTAYVLNQLDPSKRQEVIDAYFSDEGARYSLTRTHMNSCDFSLGNYSYAPIAGDTDLQHFSLEEDEDDLIPLIQDAQNASSEGFRIVASPWTAPPWMKTNNAWFAGRLKKEYYPTWARFFTKYIDAYREHGIEVWGFTVENEPLGNDSNWESMHYTPDEMADFITGYLSPELAKEGYGQRILAYDQNRGKELEEWAERMLGDPEVAKSIHGTAVHWYTSTVDWLPASLEKTHELAPEKHLIHTEGCIDAEVPHWQDDAWYWSKEATDWGFEWAKPENKKNHPVYVPVYRYARDIIGCLNTWVEGWIDWNMVLDRQGGPNHASNWCIAPVIVDTATKEVYYTPLYDVMKHFSKYIRPDAKRIGWRASWDDPDLMCTAVKNQDGSRICVALNQSEKDRVLRIEDGNGVATLTLPPRSLQTLIIQ